MFVEWVRAVGIEELQPLDYRVTVLVRSLLANGEEPYRRQPPFTVTVDVRVTESGAQVLMPPVFGELTQPDPNAVDPGPCPGRGRDRGNERQRRRRR